MADYFWVEPEPEPVVTPDEVPVELDAELQAAREAAAKHEMLKSQQDRAKEQENTIARLSMPLKQKQMSKYLSQPVCLQYWSRFVSDGSGLLFSKNHQRV